MSWEDGMDRAGCGRSGDSSGQAERQMIFQPIENYGLIGNLCTAALVGIDSSIDFMCFPEFDSPTVFAALLDPERGGSFAIRPQIDGVQSKQMYAAESNVLITRFLSGN